MDRVEGGLFFNGENPLNLNALKSVGMLKIFNNEETSIVSKLIKSRSFKDLMYFIHCPTSKVLRETYVAPTFLL